jgi:hypothetical protein
MIRRTICALLLSLVSVESLHAQEKPAAGGTDKKAEPAKGESALPADVQNFYGQVTATVVSVDLAKAEMKVKVVSAKAEPDKSKAPKPDALTGMTINVTPLLKKGTNDKDALDENSVAYIKGAKAGDSVTISVRASSKSVDFRLLKVPTAGHS